MPKPYVYGGYFIGLSMTYHAGLSQPHTAYLVTWRCAIDQMDVIFYYPAWSCKQSQQQKKLVRCEC